MYASSDLTIRRFPSSGADATSARVSRPNNPHSRRACNPQAAAGNPFTPPLWRPTTLSEANARHRAKSMDGLFRAIPSIHCGLDYWPASSRPHRPCGAIEQRRTFVASVRQAQRTAWLSHCRRNSAPRERRCDDRRCLGGCSRIFARWPQPRSKRQQLGSAFRASGRKAAIRVPIKRTGRPIGRPRSASFGR